MRPRLLTTGICSAAGVFALTAGMLAVTAGSAAAAPPPPPVCPTVDAVTGAVTNPTPAAGVNWHGCNLTNANLNGATLTGADLGAANLTNATFNNASVGGIILTSANLTGASLTNVNLSSVAMSNANLTQAVVKAANLAGTVMTGDTLTKVVGRQLTGTPVLPAGWKVISGSLVGPGADLSNDNLVNADLSNMNLTGTIFDHSNLTGVNFNGANLTGASFVGAVLTNANLSGVGLAGDNLSGVVSGGITGNPTSLPAGWSLKDGFLIGPGASLARANLSGLNLAGANLSGINLSSASLVSTNLSGANLSNSDLSGANLTGADLFRANLSGVTWSSTTCPNSRSSNGLTGGCSQQLAFRTGGFLTPVPGSKIRKAAHSFAVRFRLTNFQSQKITNSIGNSLTSNREVRVTLNGRGIATVFAHCSWNSTIGKFGCTIHFPGTVKKGHRHNYSIRIQENYGRGWAKAPVRSGASNPLIIHFK
jgi:uncharacterized protein YjbI with pentapeptide repeats